MNPPSHTPMNRCFSTLVFILAVLGASRAAGQNFSIPWSTTDGGGGPASGGGLSLHGTIGQPDAGAMSGGGFSLAGGYEAGTGSGIIGPCPTGVPTNSYVIDPALSIISVSGHLGGYTLVSQGASSLTTAYEGVIRAVISSNQIGFPGGSLIDAQVSGAWQPLPGGDSGTAPADYGGVAVGPLGIVTIYATLRNLVLDLDSPCVPLNGGQFAATALTFLPASNPSPTVDVRALTPFPVPFTGPFTAPMPNQAVAAGVLEVTDPVETLTVPFHAIVPLTVLSPNDSLLNFQGAIVARRTNAPPRLAIRLGTPNGGFNTVILSWPNPSAGFVLQQTSNMNAPGGGWTDVTQPPVIIGPNKEVTLEATGSSRLFRLRKP